MSDLDYIKAKCDQFGYTFFERESMRFWNSRIGKVLRINENTYRMVTSERMDYESPRKYTVREFVINANSITRSDVSEFQEFYTSHEANSHIKDGI